MHRSERAGLEAMQVLFDHIIDEGVGVILDTGSFAALHARLSKLFQPLAQVFAGEAGEEVDDSRLRDVARALATRVAIDLWNTTPIPDNQLRPHPPMAPGRDAPCPCGSQRKFGQCCSAVDSPGLILPPEEMLARALARLPKARIGEIRAFGVPPQTLARIAETWFDEQRYEDIVTLLASLFDDVSRLDEDAVLAADMLGNAYLELGDEPRRRQLVETLKGAPCKALRADGLQREAVMSCDRGDLPSAWAAFRGAQHLDPDDPMLAHVEVALLLAEGRDTEARVRAEFWCAKLARDTERDHSELIGVLQRMLAIGETDEVDERLAALPRDFPARRLVLHVELDDITPPIWRRLELENSLSFDALHLVLQAAMGWENEHLYEFIVGDHHIGPAREDEPAWGEPVLPDHAVMIGQVLGRKKSFRYLYDFGDGWAHRITIEERLPSSPTERPAVLLAGGRACPPEDCGGVPGYNRLLETLAHPRNEDQRETLEWLGSYEAEAFKVTSMRKAVASLFKRI